jgi:thymidylate kinase
MLLRIPSVPAAPTGDVDILVARSDVEALRDAATQSGFVAMPGWDRAPELLLVSYDRDSDRWLVLDVSTEICFPASRWRLGPKLVEAVLDQRRQAAGMTVPADGDAFWLLLLHCVLQKGRIAEHYRSRLRQFAQSALPSPLGAAACSPAGARVTPGDLVCAAGTGDWDAVAELGSRLSLELRRRASRTLRLRLLARGLTRKMRKPLLVVRRRGVNVALLGPNGVGKSTAARSLQRSLPFESRVIYMGVWKSSARRSGGRGRQIGEIATRPLRIWLRYMFAQYHQSRGRVVIFDRYVYEAMLPAQPPLATLKSAYFRLLARSIPPPSAGVVLDVAGHVAYRRKQENPPAELESERRVYAGLTNRLSSLQVVDASADAEDVKAEITAIIWRAVRARWGRSRDARC